MPDGLIVGDPVTRRLLTDEDVRCYAEEGYLLLPGLIPRDTAEALRQEVQAILDIIGLGRTKLRQSHEYREGSLLDAFVNSPNLRRVAERLMGGPSTVYLPFTAVKSGGGGGRFHFHQDNQYTRFDGPGINLWTALSPMTEENGCLQIVPRSHTNGTLPSFSPEGDGHKAVTFEPEAFLPVRMLPGDCVAFSRLTVHGSGVNDTPNPRIAYAVQFHRDDVRYSTDGGVTWRSATQEPRWSTGPVRAITPPQGDLDGH